MTLADLARAGLAGGTNVLGLMAVDTLGNWVHAAEGGLVLTAAALTGRSSPTRRAADHPNSSRPATPKDDGPSLWFVG